MRFSMKFTPLLLALVELPNFSTPMNSIALSLEKLSGRDKEGPGSSEWDDLLSNDPERGKSPPQAGTPAAPPQSAPAPEKET